MYFNTAIAAIVLATVVSAAPFPNGTATTTAAATAATVKPLSLTAQLTLADTAIDRFALIPNDSDFVFNFGDPAKKSGNPNGDIIVANRKTFPALVGSGAGMAMGFLNACGLNTPHVHPRSVELQVVTQGQLVTEMLPENGVFRNGDPKQGRRVITNTVKTNQMTPFYQGSVHTQYNPDCTPAVFVAAFNSEDFGAGQVADEFLSVSPDVVAAVFGNTIDGADIDSIKASVSVNVAKGVEACLKKCGIQKRQLER